MTVLHPCFKAGVRSSQEPIVHCLNPVFRTKLLAGPSHGAVARRPRPNASEIEHDQARDRARTHFCIHEEAEQIGAVIERLVASAFGGMHQCARPHERHLVVVLSGRPRRHRVRSRLNPRKRVNERGRQPSGGRSIGFSQRRATARAPVSHSAIPSRFAEVVFVLLEQVGVSLVPSAAWTETRTRSPARGRWVMPSQSPVMVTTSALTRGYLGALPAASVGTRRWWMR